MEKVIYLDNNKQLTLKAGELSYLFKIEKENSLAEVLVDLINNRLRVLKLEGQNINQLLQSILEIAKLNHLGKIWAVATPGQWQLLFKNGYILEGILPKYFGEEEAYYMAYFLNPSRRISKLIEEEDALIKNLQQQNLNGNCPDLPIGYEMRLGTLEDANELANFYDKIFPTYPTPMHNPNYVKKMINNCVIFNLVLWNGNIIAAASADIEESSKTAEMTDIACDPEHRGKQIPVIAIKRLEEKMQELNMKTLYTLARAKLPGINKVFYRLGYEYYGRLINNCDIFDGYEDMNLLVKIL
ncbi:MAG: putative beta-lysine N-acetyltransferase [Bacillota bacterium]